MLPTYPGSNIPYRVYYYVMVCTTAIYTFYLQYVKKCLILCVVVIFFFVLFVINIFSSTELMVVIMIKLCSYFCYSCCHRFLFLMCLFFYNFFLVYSKKRNWRVHVCLSKKFKSNQISKIFCIRLLSTTDI